jgi:hypothetical protein
MKPVVHEAARGGQPVSPYSGLEPRAFWKTGVAARAPLDPGQLFRPKFPVTRSMKIVTAGSCFAQHVGRALLGAGFRVLDAEPLPPVIPDAVAQAFGYRLYSARYGNVYTVAQLLQMLREADGEITPALPVWEKAGRFFDAQRPGIEPDGLESAELVRKHRKSHLGAVQSVFREADLLVFTLGLTEAWVHTATGTVYPTAPGTVAGSYDPGVFSFKNYECDEVIRDFEAVRARLMRKNPKLRFLLTVSPVPLTATASGEHVEVASCYSKAVLRAACGALYQRHDNVEYYPSFELITSQNARGAYYEPGLRSVSTKGVDAAMELFLRAHGVTGPETAAKPGAKRKQAEADTDELVCEEALLEAFS